MNPLSLVPGNPWMIRAEVLDAMVRAAAGAGRPGIPRADSGSEARGGGPALDVRLGVAVIPVYGPIYRHSTPLDDYLAFLFGGISLDAVAASFRSALAAADVRAILFDFDCPGGEVTGIGSLAAEIRAGAAAKPVAAFASGDCTSAAYYLASATHEIVADAAARVGSIGVVVPWIDATEMMKAAGLRDITIVSSQSPDKWSDPATPEGRPQWQATVDSLAALFVADVAKYRGVTADKVLADFGKGWYLVGEGARRAGLVDKVGTLEATIAKLSGPNRSRLAAGGRAAAESPSAPRPIRAGLHTQTPGRGGHVRLVLPR